MAPRRASAPCWKAPAYKSCQPRPDSVPRIAHYMEVLDMPKPFRALAEVVLNLPLFSPVIALAILLPALIPDSTAPVQTKQQEVAQEEVGVWRVNYAQQTITTTLYTEGGSTYMHQHFDDGSELEERLTERDGRYYLPDGEWFVIASNGNLDLNDAGGLIWSARPHR